MNSDPRVIIKLAGGGDEVVPAKNLTYLRKSLDSEMLEEPGAASTIILGSIAITSQQSAKDLAALFEEHVAIVELLSPNEYIIYVNGNAVKDVDNAPTTMPNSRSWLVFGYGPTARRIGVIQSRDQLKEIWELKNLDPNAAGI